jgi:hypothetical protein
MKVRQSDELFERDDAPRRDNAETAVVARPFREHMRSTRAAPLSPSLQALLWAAGVIVALLFGAAIWKMNLKKSQRRAVTAGAPSAPARI